ncbi:MAG: thioredoxin family protein [Planctomycetes bacterium]|nr:thioredoxin family protein [Planctomycetota bacterium]
MARFGKMTLVVALLAATGAQVPASSPASQPASAATQPSGTVAQAYPSLTSAALAHATLADLPAGTLLRAGEVIVNQADLDAEIASAPEALREQLHRNAFFLLEQTATRRLLLQEARTAAGRDGKDVAAMSEQDLLQTLLVAVTAGVTVTDAEVAAFYAANREMVGGQPLEAVREAIAQYVQQQKQQNAIAAYVEATGRRVAIEVDAAWVRRQAALAMDNPVDKARASGRPSLVDFGAQGCIPCDKLAPILEAMKTKYEGRANVVFISVRQEQILASRYGIQSIPVQVFFDRDGKEVFRHTGFWPQDELEAKLAELGVR